MSDNPLGDSRWRDLGLTESEIKAVLFICKKFVNGRDSLDDIVQTAAIAIMSALNAYKEQDKIINNRTSFFVRVVKCKLIEDYIKANRKDLIYNTVDVDEADDQKISKIVLGSNSEYSKFEFELNSLIDSAIPCNKDKYIAYAYLYLKMNQAEIGDTIGIHQTLVCDRLKCINAALAAAYLEYNKAEED